MSAQLGRAAAFFRVPPGERPWPLHPFLVPPSLIFWLARANLETTPWTVLAHALGLYELGVVGLWLLLALLSRNLRSSAAATTLLAILALHDGELHDLEVVLPIFPVSLGAVVWGLVLLAAGWLVWRGRRLEALTFSINLALGLAAGYQGALLAWTAWQKPAASASQLEEEPLPTAVRAASERPDVVYLILDGMGRLACELVDLDLCPITEARARMGVKQVVLGNIHPVRVLRDGTPDSVRTAIAECHQQAGSRYIVGAGCEVPRGTPEANMMALKDYARSHRA